ncbi:MAG: pseudouridine synthase [Acidobacteria bacterium]|nr:pseudouridine synthase [Acidobacteriota bacterium]
MARLILFYKPYGVLSQFTPEPGAAHRTLQDFINIPNIYPAGRLDHDSEGLLLLTDDGALQHTLTDPRFAHTRTYWAQVEGIPTSEALTKLRQGIQIRDYKTRPAQVRLLDNEPQLPPRDPPIRFRQSIPTAWLEITLTEGRNRQVRRMTAAVGHPTLRLVRVRSGHYTLEGLQPGEWREITAAAVPPTGSPPRARKDRSRKPARSARVNSNSR